MKSRGLEHICLKRINWDLMIPHGRPVDLEVSLAIDLKIVSVEIQFEKMEKLLVGSVRVRERVTASY